MPTNSKITPMKSTQANIVASGDGDAVDDDDGLEFGLGLPTSKGFKMEVTPLTSRSMKRGRLASKQNSDYEGLSSLSRKRARKAVPEQNSNDHEASLPADRVFDNHAATDSYGLLDTEVNHEDFVNEKDDVMTVVDKGVNFKMEFPEEKPLDLL